MTKMFSLLFLILAITTVSSDVPKRNVTTVFWPNCNESKYNASCNTAKEMGLNIVYSKATTPSHDNLYYVFSTIGIPTVMVVHVTGEDTDLHFNWNQLVNETDIKGAITFVPEPKNIQYRFGVSFTKLIEYDDVHDDADLIEAQDAGVSWNIRRFNNFTWMELAGDNLKNTFVFNTTDDLLPPDESNNGSISFSFVVRKDDGRDAVLPSLKYTSNETQFDFEINKFTPSFNHSRFALEVVVVSDFKKSTDMAIDTSSTIDDEYTPGVFKIVDWFSNTNEENTDGFIQWKPVAYLAKGRGRNVATKVDHYSLENKTESSLLNESILFAFFGDSLWNEKAVIQRASNISFGIGGDGYYLKNNFTVWTACVGVGSPPEESISATVIIIISAGLGLPVIIILFGGIFTIVRRLRNGSYDPLKVEVNHPK